MGAEDIEQVNLMAWLSYNHSDIYEDTIHIANQRQTTQQQGRLLKRMGVKKGVSDIFIAVPMNGRGGLWIELKSTKGKPSQEQKVFVARMIRRGYDAAIVYGCEAAKEVILAYLGRQNISPES